ncbi:MAG TPA: response regulator [Kofleriaceae bacterium]
MNHDGTVLVVEDDLDIREVMRMVLEASGYQVLEAGDGAEALEVARAHRPRIILLDLMMPGMDGFQFRESQLQDPAIASIPVVIVSGGGAVPQKAAELGAAGYLVKPTDVQRLLAVMGDLCRAGGEAQPRVS